MSAGVLESDLSIVTDELAYETKDAAKSTPLRKDLRCMLADGAAFSLMVGIGETYLPAFVLALGMGEIASGLVATVPMLLGSIMQLIAPWAVRKLQSRRKWVVTCAALQGASLLLLPLVAFAGNQLGWLVFVAATLYWAAGLATGPAWNIWVESLVPSRIRAPFMATRVRVCQVAILIGFVTGGLLLQNIGTSIDPAVVFATMFLVAAGARFLSAGFLFGQSELVERASSQPFADTSLRDVVTGLSESPARWVLAYFLAMQVAVFTAAPYFTPFMLKTLGMSYFEFMTLIAIGFIGKVIALPAFGRFAKQTSARRLLWIGGLGVAPISALWLVSRSFAFLAVVQLVGGIVWAAFELAMFLMFFDALPRHQRTGLLTLYNLGNALAMVCGGMIGASLLLWFGQHESVYLTIFLLSAIGRCCAAILLWKIPNVPTDGATTQTRTIAVRPNTGSIEQPILATNEE